MKFITHAPIIVSKFRQKMSVSNNPFTYCNDPSWAGSCPSTGLCQFQPSLLSERINNLFNIVSPGFSKIADCQAFATWADGGSCLCSAEGSRLVRIIDYHPGLFEVVLGDEGAADSISCKSDGKKTDFLCRGSGIFSKYSVEISQGNCIERTTPANEDEAEEIAICGKENFILLSQLLNPSASSLSEEAPNREPKTEASDSNPDVFDFDYNRSGKRQPNSSETKNLQTCLYKNLKQVFEKETAKDVAKLAAERFANQSNGNPKIEEIANSIIDKLQPPADSSNAPNYLTDIDKKKIASAIKKSLQQCTEESDSKPTPTPTPTPTPDPKSPPVPTPAPTPIPRKREKITIKFKKRPIRVNPNPNPTPTPNPTPSSKSNRRYSHQKTYGSKSNNSSTSQIQMTAGLATVTALLAYIGREIFKERNDGGKEVYSTPSKKSVPMRRSVAAKKL